MTAGSPFFDRRIRFTITAFLSLYAINSIKPDDAHSRLAFIKDELELLSIMSTDKGYCCMINEKLLYKGDTIKGLRVTEITSSSVHLSNGAMNITLKLSNEF